MKYNDLMAWVDTETTGFPDEDPEHRITEVCVIVTDTQLTVVDEFETKIALDAVGQQLFPQELRDRMGYSDEEWKDAPPESAALWRRFLRLMDGTTWCGQNADFDEQIVLNALTRCSVTYFNRNAGKRLPDRNWQRRLYDTKAFAWSIMHDFDVRNAKGYQSASLQDVYPVLGLPELPKHRARSDLLKCHALYRIFVLEGYPAWKARRKAEIAAAQNVIVAP